MCQREPKNIMRCCFIGFVDKARLVHGDRFNYDESSYVSARTDVRIRCAHHGWFMQKGSAHLKGHSCKSCEMVGYNKSNYMKRCIDKYNNVSSVYLIKCFNSNESFYKIGITMMGVRRRFKSTSLPYNYTELAIVKMSAEDSWDNEIRLHRLNWEFNYQPKIKFFGSKKECFSQLTPEVLDFFGINYDSIA